MSLKLPIIPRQYDPATEATRNRLLEQAFAECFRRDRDSEVGRGRLILRAPDGSRWSVVVDNAGVLGTEAL